MSLFNKIIFVILVSFLAIPALSFAQDNWSRVISVVNTDWKKDGSTSRALLIENEDNADLAIYLNTTEDHPQPTVYKSKLVWRGMLWGTQPELRLTKNNSLQVISQNDAIGRDRWKQVLTISYRNAAFLVTGFTYQSHDTLDPKQDVTCDVNLLTGKGVRNHKAFKTDAKPVLVADWKEDAGLKMCQP